MMKVYEIEIRRIVMAKGRRAIQQNVVNGLVESIAKIGLRTPISVRMVDGVPHLITGRHRVEAMRSRGKSTIQAHVFDDDDDARIWELDENLRRADLTDAERMEHMSMRAKLIEERDTRLREQSDEGRYAKREDAKAAGQKYFYPAQACPKRGHEGKRYVSTTHCVMCERERQRVVSAKAKGSFEKTQSNTTAKVANDSPLLQDRPRKMGRGQKGGNREAARQLGVSKDTIRKAKMFDKLKPAAKDEAVRLGIQNKHYALRFAAAHDTVALQIRALNSQVRVMAEKAERKRRAQMTVREQAEAAIGAEPRVIARVEHAREVTTSYWLWLIEEFGEHAYGIVNRLREVDTRLLFEIADKDRADGLVPKPRLH